MGVLGIAYWYRLRDTDILEQTMHTEGNLRLKIDLVLLQCFLKDFSASFVCYSDALYLQTLHSQTPFPDFGTN